MILPILCSLALSSTPATGPAVVLSTAVLMDEEVDKQIAALGEDVEKLMELAAQLKSDGNRDGARSAYRRVIEIDPMHKKARKGLRHHFYDGKWFESYAKLSKYRREEAKMRLEKYGEVRYNDQWVPQADVPFLRMGWEKIDGEWQNPRVVNEAKRVSEMKEAGFTLRKDDMTWLSEEEVRDKWSAQPQLWKCGEDWLTMEEANKYHSEIGKFWRLGGERFEVRTTCNWEFGNKARWHADLLFPELVKIFGKTPEKPPVIVVLSSLAQYNDFAAGNQEQQRMQTEAEGFSSLHHAYFGDLYFDGSEMPPIYIGAGVAYWDAETGSAWGPHSVRHAVAQSYCDVIDRSWNTISEMLDQSGGGGGQGSFDQFWKEKKIPRWLRYGAASYVERYADDKVVGWAVEPTTTFRDWSKEELKKTGLRPVEEIIGFGLSLDDIDSSSRLIHEAGAIVLYMMTANDSDVMGAHQAFKNALKKGEGTEEATEALHKVLVEKESNIRKFLGV